MRTKIVKKIILTEIEIHEETPSRCSFCCEYRTAGRCHLHGKIEELETELTEKVLPVFLRTQTCLDSVVHEEADQNE